MGDKTIQVGDELDIVAARQAGRELSRSLGFNIVDQTRITTAISELARNIVLYAGKGIITLSKVKKGDRFGIEITARDNGPGIVDIELAMQDGYSTSNGLGAGLPGVRRLMDEFELKTAAGKGTTVRIVKWLR
ncbi:MAG: anti-sigma regulatory factor [Bacillota bacterium]|jgi:serine/threonine-protein kinase RsbT